MLMNNVITYNYIICNNVIFHQWTTTPLDYASEGGHLQVVHLLTARGAKLDFRDEVGLL